MHMSLPLIALLATASFASPLGAADWLATLEKRYDKTRLTQHASQTCGPEGHSRAIAYSKSGCADDSTLGEIDNPTNYDPANGEACINVGTYMINEPNAYGYRITSIKFV
ncbi:MAG: hypothetical protein OHK93_001569 [Ramalina farinacea]|uniref:Uncharacterized protein n=1 Tax=Ramalina farinacea TaxID=258253 RepID=A0AA43QRT9_9LECA|nr:hypothetical protein [Ramalina farinacea]